LTISTFTKIPVKVAFMLGSLNRGGVETMLLDVLHYSKQSDFHLTGIYRYDGNLSKEYLASGIPIVKQSPGNYLRILGYLDSLRNVFKKNGINIVHTHQSLDTIYAWLATIGLKIKIIQTVHSFDFEGGYSGQILKRISFMISDKLIFVSSFQKEYYQNKYFLHPHKIKVVYNGVDFGKFVSDKTPNFKPSLHLKETDFLMGMVGNFSPGRDHMTICRFLLLLKESGFHFYFAFIGSENRSSPDLYYDCVGFCMKNNLTDRVFFLGERKDVPEILPQLDSFIFSTKHDTFSISLIEAIAAGIPVFVNDWEVMKEITENGKKAVLFQNGNEADLLKQFLLFQSGHLISDKKVTKENACWARDKFHIRNYLMNIIQVYREILN